MMGSDRGEGLGVGTAAPSCSTLFIVPASRGLPVFPHLDLIEIGLPAFRGVWIKHGKQISPIPKWPQT